MSNGAFCRMAAGLRGAIAWVDSLSVDWPEGDPMPMDLDALEAHNDEWGDIPADSCAAIIRELRLAREVVRRAKQVEQTLNGGFVVCKSCGDQTDLTDTDYRHELELALAAYYAEAAHAPDNKGPPP